MIFPSIFQKAIIAIGDDKTLALAKEKIDKYLQKKDLASRAHVSQYSGGGPGFLGFMPPAIRQRLLDWDRFTRAFPPPGSAVEHDLFAGI